MVPLNFPQQHLCLPHSLGLNSPPKNQDNPHHHCLREHVSAVERLTMQLETAGSSTLPLLPKERSPGVCMFQEIENPGISKADNGGGRKSCGSSKHCHPPILYGQPHPRSRSSSGAVTARRMILRVGSG